MREGLPRLRRRATYRALLEAFRRGCEKAGFRLVQFSVQTNHMHMIIEAKNREQLARGMQGLTVRMARALNRIWGRSGSVFADRYHDRILRTPREVRNALVYVLRNAARHGNFAYRDRPDPYSSGPWFDGWLKRIRRAAIAAPVAKARTWLASFGWRKHGEIPLAELPAR